MCMTIFSRNFSKTDLETQNKYMVNTAALHHQLQPEKPVRQMF